VLEKKRFNDKGNQKLQQLAYIKLNKSETKDMLPLLEESLDLKDLDAGSIDILSASLKFYPGYRLFEITDRSASPVKKRFVIYKRDTIQTIDYTNSPIYDLNKKAPINLTKDTLFDYIRFFFTFVRGRHGRFIVVESTDDIQWREEPAVSLRRDLNGLIEPLVLKEITSDGSYVVGAKVIFKDALFACNVNIKQNGIVRLSNQKLLAENLPVIDDILGV
tara:strand:- start:152078 stop:152734 length:657 start_codon:yes stop_codon:yes gene_type:complete